RIVEEMLRTPITGLIEREWSKSTAHRLRRELVRRIEEHVERKLRTVAYLEAL
ncbi:MAG: DNA repair protein RecO, partial [bacterium]|nr:DNA repair protein RecO [bacterium]